MTDPDLPPIQDSDSLQLPPDIHFIIDQKDVGPLDRAEILRLYGEGLIGAATPAWHPALDNWQEIGNLPEIAWLIAVPARSAEKAKPAPDLADFATRFAAGSIDMLIWFIMVTVIGTLLGMVMNHIEGVAGPVLGVRFNILAQIAALLYFIIPMSQLGGGETPGYWIFGLKLVDRDNLQPPGLIQTFIWYMTTYVRLIGCLTFFIDTQNRMLHNLVSRTLVINVPGRPGLWSQS